MRLHRTNCPTGSQQECRPGCTVCPPAQGTLSSGVTRLAWGINLLMFNKVKFNQIVSISGKPQKVTLINRIGSYYTPHSKVQVAANIFSFHDFFVERYYPLIVLSALAPDVGHVVIIIKSLVMIEILILATPFHFVAFCAILWPIPPLPPGGPPTTIRYWGALWVL
jgi:hypothetical protein